MAGICEVFSKLILVSAIPLLVWLSALKLEKSGRQ